jgi:parvulin-like peptidyl-prolyl isomerase
VTINDHQPPTTNAGRAVWVCAYGLIVLLTALTVPATAGAEPGATVALVVVNGDTITTAALDRELIASHQTMDETVRRDFDYRKLLTKLVNDRLLVQEAEAIGIRDEPALRESYISKRNIHAASLWVKDHYQPQPSFDESEVRRYFGLNFSRVRMRMITMRTADSTELIRVVLRGGADMDSLARAVSIDSYGAQGGLRPTAYRKDLDLKLRALTDTIPVFAFSAVIPFHSVFAVIRLEERLPEDPDEFETMRPGIESWLRKRENTKQWEAFLADLRTRVAFSADPTALAAIKADSARLFSQDFTQGSEATVMAIDGTPQITDRDFRRKVSHLVMSARDDSYAELFKRALRDLTEEVVLTEMARAMGYHQRPEVLAAFDRALDSVAIETYLAETVVPRITFQRTEFDSYYRDHIEDFRRPDQLQFDRIVVDSESVAMAIHARLRDGADFHYVAEQFGATASTPEESAEWIPTNAFPDFVQNELTTLAVGHCLTPRQVEEGWLLLKLRSRRDGGYRSAAEVEPTVRAVIFQQEFKTELDAVLAQLKSASVIEYNEVAIAEYFNDGS